MWEAWVGSLPPPTPNGADWPAWLEAATGKIMRCNTRLSKEKKCAQWRNVRASTHKVHLAEIQLQLDSADEEVRSILSNSQAKLAEIFQTSVECNMHLSSSNWLRYGDTCSKSFFDFHRIGKKKTPMRELNTESDTITGQSDLAQYVTEYYSLDALAPDTKGAQAECWSSVLVKVEQDINS